MAFVVGNVGEDTLEGIMSSPKSQMVYQDIAAGVQQCRSSCEYFCVCGGGSPSPKLYENGTYNSTETLACQLRIKAVGNAVLDFLENKHGFGRRPKPLDSAADGQLIDAGSAGNLEIGRTWLK